MVDVLQVFGAYSLLLIIVGTLGNMLIFATCMRLQKNTTFIFLRFLSISDTVALYFWNLNHFLVPFFDIDLETVHYMSCKIVMYLQFASLQISAWILVSEQNIRFVSTKLTTHLGGTPPTIYSTVLNRPNVEDKGMEGLPEDPVLSLKV